LIGLSLALVMRMKCTLLLALTATVVIGASAASSKIKAIWGSSADTAATDLSVLIDGDLVQ
jgi:hypothetical protein